MKKSTTTKRTRGSSSSTFDNKIFLSTNAKSHFHNSVKKRSCLNERVFEIDSPWLDYFDHIIKQRGWQEFCKQPKVIAMTIVHKFYANTFEGPASVATIRERQIQYDFGTINALLKIQNAPHRPNQVTMLNDTADMDEMSQVLCSKAVTWTMARGIRTAFATKELQPAMKIWHHFVCARLVPTSHLTKVMQDRALLLYDIRKGLIINVGWWISSNIRHIT